VITQTNVSATVRTMMIHFNVIQNLRLRKVTATRKLKADHSLNQSHHARNTAEYTEVKQRRAWTKEEIREVIWCYMYCRQHFTDDYKKVYEI
jgi:hypothetical protein